MVEKVTESIFYVGANDHDLDLFEGQYIIPNGMAYNSYVIVDDKIVVFDTIDKSKTGEWLDNLAEVLGERTPDYLVVQHMEPDHSASINAFAEKYPKTAIVGNKKTFTMIEQFFPELDSVEKVEVKDGETLDLGSHKLTLRVCTDGSLAGSHDDLRVHQKRYSSRQMHSGNLAHVIRTKTGLAKQGRYYFGIVGKYGTQVQAVLKKAKDLYIEKICPLHGPILEEDLGYYIDLYDKWSGYRPETEGVCICYTSVYGNTKKAAELLRDELAENGVETIEMSDLARCDMAEAVEDAFRYDRLVLATTTYNGGMFPFMQQFIDELTERNFQNRYVGFIENGSWGPAAMRAMKKELEEAKNIKIAENNVTIKSKLNDASRGQIEALAKELTPGHMDLAAELAEPAEKKTEEGKKKGFVCNICGYVYEGDTLPDDFVCPLCKHPASDFSPL